MSVLLGLGKLMKLIGRWLMADWRNALLAWLGLVLAIHMLLIEPRLRSARDDARLAATACEGTVANLKAASAEAEAVQAANLGRVAAERQAVNQGVRDDYQTRLAALRERHDALARRLRGAAAQADPGLSGAAGMPGAVAAAGRADAAPGDHGLPAGIATGPACPALTLQATLGQMTLGERLIASEQAQQLDSLITAIERQAAIPTSPVDRAKPSEKPGE